MSIWMFPHKISHQLQMAEKWVQREVIISALFAQSLFHAKENMCNKTGAMFSTAIITQVKKCIRTGYLLDETNFTAAFDFEPRHVSQLLQQKINWIYDDDLDLSPQYINKIGTLTSNREMQQFKKVKKRGSGQVGVSQVCKVNLTMLTYVTKSRT